MAAVRISFTAYIAKSGYRWQGNVLVAHEGEHIKRFPLGNSTLFLDFAQLPEDRDAMIAFANDHGPLRDQVARAGILRLPASDADTYELWQMQISWMSLATDLWQALHPFDDQLVRHFIKWNGDGPRLIDHPLPLRNPARKIKRGDWLTAGLAWLAEIIGDMAPADLRPCVHYDNREKRLVATVEPATLEGGLWLQFAHAITNGKPIIFCPSCGRPIDISDDGSRSDRKFCTDACRQRESRRRRKEARRLREQGETLRSIARHFDVKMATVKKWLL